MTSFALTPRVAWLIMAVCVITTFPSHAFAQGPNPFIGAPYLRITREEVKAGKNAAHTAIEAAWAAAMLKGRDPREWLGMTALVGPTDAWFITPLQSFAAWQKTETAFESMAAVYKADVAKYAKIS